jgi:hypothetical protein
MWGNILSHIGVHHTSKGLSDVPLVGGLCHVQWTLTTKGLNELPLIGDWFSS